MENFWSEKNEFWGNKTLDNKAYIDQAEEVRRDLRDLVYIHKIKRVIDVGGYKGRIGEEPIGAANYVNLDIVNGFDITKDWEEQGMVVEPKTLCFTSLVLICIPPESIDTVVAQMKKFSKVLYFFEESRPLPHRHKLNDDFGGKWSYDLREFFPKADFKISSTNPTWVKVTSVL